MRQQLASFQSFSMTQWCASVPLGLSWPSQSIEQAIRDSVRLVTGQQGLRHRFSVSGKAALPAATACLPASWPCHSAQWAVHHGCKVWHILFLMIIARCLPFLPVATNTLSPSLNKMFPSYADLNANHQDVGHFHATAASTALLSSNTFNAHS